MLFPSIFHVNGEAVVARVDENRETSSFNGHLRSRLGLTDGDSVVVSVPIGEINHSCRAVVIAGEHAEDLVLGSTWLRRFYMDALQIMRSPGESHQDYGVGLQYTSGHSVPCVVGAGSSNAVTTVCPVTGQTDIIGATVQNGSILSQRPSGTTFGCGFLSNNPLINHLMDIDTTNPGKTSTPNSLVGTCLQKTEPSVNHNRLTSEITLYFACSPIDIVRCNYPRLSQYLEEHGLSISTWSMSEARSMLAYHLLFGMCAGHRGNGCKHIANTSGKHATTATVSNFISTLWQTSQIDRSNLRFLCNVIGLVVPSASSISETFHQLHDSLVTSRELTPQGFDLQIFFSDLDKVSRADVFWWCSEHGIYPSGASRLVKESLLKHVLFGECLEPNSALRSTACQDVIGQHITTFRDVDKSAFVLSVACLSPRCSTDTKCRILKLATNLQLCKQTRSTVQDKLRQHIYTLRRGRAVYHGVLRASYGGKDFTLLNSISSAWPTIADTLTKEEIKCNFENAIITQSTCRDVCASCSVKYTPDRFTDVSSAEHDFSPFSAPDDLSSYHMSLDESGPLSNLVLDERGVLLHTEQEARLRLCHDCTTQVTASRMPKFALANYLYFGDVPDVLRDLSPVEENMITLCRARCILVQLKTMRGGSTASQRAYCGHAIFHQQDTTKIMTLVPPSIEDILAPICVLFIGSTRPSVKWIRKHAKPLVVRANHVRHALQWLKTNNPLYSSTEINHEVLDTIERAGGLPYDVEYMDDGVMSSGPTSSHNPSDNAHAGGSFIDSLHNDAPSNPIPIENLVITDLENASTPQDLHTAALRHLKSGKGFFMYGHSATPESEYHNPALFPSLYPTLYPYGVGGFDDNRRHPKSSMTSLVRHLLNIVDSRFREHPLFIFSVFNILQRREVCQQTTMRVSRDTFASKLAAYANLDPTTIQRVSEEMEKGQYNFDEPDEQNVVALMRDVHQINSSVMGSCAARLKMRNEIRGMITMLGAPSFFITINPADVYNPLINFLAGNDINMANLLPEQVLDYRHQSHLIAKDSVLAARFFHIYIKAFFDTVLRFSTNPSDDIHPGVLGVTKGYYGTVEAQGRGSLHCHMLLWLEGGLNPADIRDRLLNDPDSPFEHRLISYLEENIQTAIPDDPGDISDVPSSQRHPCSVRPIFKKEDESVHEYSQRRLKDLHNLAKQCQMHVHNAGCYKNRKGPPSEKTCHFNMDESRRNDHTYINRATGEVHGQCVDGMVNQFNDSMLEIVRCNMDIKFIGSGYGAHAVLYYITDYISKMQLKTHAAYNVLEAAIRRLNKYDTDENTTSNQRGRKVLLKYANAVIAKQELSAQQIASYLLGNGDCYSSHKHKEVYWKSYVNYVNHFFPALEHSDSDDLSPAHPLPQTIDPVTREVSIPMDEGLADTHDEFLASSADLLSDPIMGCNPFITVAPDMNGHLVPKGNRVADYVYQPTLMNDMCLWDFLSLTNKTRHQNMPRDVQADADSEQEWDQVDPAPSATQLVPISLIESMYHFDSKTPPFRFGVKHSDAHTHMLSVLKPHNRYILVPQGPPLPRRDRPSTVEAYSQLMLIFFKPWTHATDLKLPDNSWNDALQQFLDSDMALYEHVQIMNNIQFLHDCRDSRDHASKSRLVNIGSHPSASQDQVSIPIEMDLSCDVDENVLLLLQKKHDDIFEDVSRIAHANSSNIMQCLQALSSGFSSGNSSHDDGFSNVHDRDVTGTTIPNECSNNRPALRTEWKALYAARKKAAKSSLHQAPANSTQPFDSVSTTANLSFDNMDYISLPLHEIDVTVSLPICNSLSQTTHEHLCEWLCHEWTLNSDQRRAFLIVANHAARHPKLTTDFPLTMLLAGAAGSGKTRVLNALRQFFSLRHEDRCLRISSFMGIAANNISGSTLHSALNLTPRTSQSSASANELKFMWEDVHYIFIDEVSMIGCEFLQTINTTLARAMASSMPFGGINVIFAGDMAQLPPVGETALSAYIKSGIGSSNPRTQNALKGKLLWLAIMTVIVLQQIKRQSGDENTRFVELLTRLCHGECNAADYRLLETQLLSPMCNPHAGDHADNNCAPVLVCDNTSKDAINLAMSCAFAADTGVVLHHYTAVDSMGGSPITDPGILHITDLLHSGRTNGRLKHLPLAIGMPVMVTTNIDVPGGIVNGSIGTIWSIDCSVLPNGDRVLNHCIVHIPSARADPMPHLAPHEFPIMPSPIPVRYETKRRGKPKRTLAFSWLQVPLIPAFAMMAHKSQGQTINKVIIDLASCHGTEAPYVMVSRVRRLDDLFILRPFPIEKIRCRMSEDSRRELARIQHHHLSTILQYGSPDEQAQAANDLRLHNLKHSHDDTLTELLGSPGSAPAGTSSPRPKKKRKVS